MYPLVLTSAAIHHFYRMAPLILVGRVSPEATDTHERMIGRKRGRIVTQVKGVDHESSPSSFLVILTELRLGVFQKYEAGSKSAELFLQVTSRK
ncbi:unnamed protein product [Calypogeia fissa]